MHQGTGIYGSGKDLYKLGTGILASGTCLYVYIRKIYLSIRNIKHMPLKNQSNVFFYLIIVTLNCSLCCPGKACHAAISVSVSS